MWTVKYGCAAVLAISLAACNLPPRQYELDKTSKAIKPASQEAAEKTVRDHFKEVLKDPDSAKYDFWK
jgi:hypothetical protein